MTSSLAVLYRDDCLVAVYKPAGMSVHRGDLSGDHHVTMTVLRDQLGMRVWPLHRLDRPTAGVLVFALSAETAAAMGAQIRAHLPQKTYLALVRGLPPDAAEIDHPLAEARDSAPRAAQTAYEVLTRYELPLSTGRFPTSRYALVRARPRTGRYHQIRKHFHHVSHPIVGDTVHGDGRHNRLFREHFDWHRLCLLAESYTLTHPHTGTPLTLTCTPDPAWQALFQLLAPSAAVSPRR